jgi:hypothetical protein
LWTVKFRERNAVGEPGKYDKTELTEPQQALRPNVWPGIIMTTTIMIIII